MFKVDCRNFIKRYNAADTVKFRKYLIQNEMSKGTIDEYTRNVDMYYRWAKCKNAGFGTITKKELEISMLEYKKTLQEKQLAATTINAKLAALNKYLGFHGIKFRLKYLRVQRRIFKEPEKELTRNEYDRLIDAARLDGREKIAMIMETLGSTGIRVSELKYITIESLDKSVIEISMKSKMRAIILSEKINEKLREYAQKNNIKSGEIFINEKGMSLSRSRIWKEMKNISEKAQISASKVYPHNLRALFARSFYEESRDIVRLGDILGHSSINTTRIYLRISARECKQQIDGMNLVA